MVTPHSHSSKYTFFFIHVLHDWGDVLHGAVDVREGVLRVLPPREEQRCVFRLMGFGGEPLVMEVTPDPVRCRFQYPYCVRFKVKGLVETPHCHLGLVPEGDLRSMDHLEGAATACVDVLGGADFHG